MATYLELHGLRGDSDLQDKVSVAVVVKAQGLLDETTPTAEQVAWANDAIASPKSKATSLLNYVLAKNEALTASQISGATDAAIQSNIDAAVDALIAGGA